MFIEGLDKCISMGQREGSSNSRSRNDAISGMKNGAGRGFGLPPAAKFRSGHLPSNAIPASNSDNDDSLGSEEEVYGGRYSLDSSPQDRRVPNGTARRFGNFNQRRL